MGKEKVKKVFRSRISILLICSMLGIFIMAFIPIIQRGIYQGMNFLFFVFVVLTFVVCGLRYIISGDKLYLKIWMIPSGSVNIADIISVERSYKKPLSFSSATSFKKLRIDLSGVKFGVKSAKFPYLLISPVREQEFIKELKAINPDIIVNVPIKKRIKKH